MKKTTIIVLVCSLLPGCVSFPPADKNQATCPLPPEVRILAQKDVNLSEKPQKITVKRNTVQFTDDGLYVRRCSLTNVINSLDRENKNDRAQIVILYVHGWKHNATYNDENLLSFDNLLKQIWEDELKTVSPRNVVGIYVGWNGKSTDIPVVKELSFWGRKRAADNISQSAILTRLIGTIDNIISIRKNTNDRAVYLGHSFGARILYSATSQLLIYNTMRAYPEDQKINRNYKEINSMKGTIVLVNPAFEASLFNVFNSLNRRYTEKFDTNQKPLLISISADNDWATRYAFPVGQLFGLRFNQEANTTLGNYEKYRTHKLLIDKDYQLGSWKKENKWFDHFCNDEVCLIKDSKNPSTNGSPFIVASAEASIVNGHNGIWEDKFKKWLAKFISELNKTK